MPRNIFTVQQFATDGTYVPKAYIGDDPNGSREWIADPIEVQRRMARVQRGQQVLLYVKTSNTTYAQYTTAQFIQEYQDGEQLLADVIEHLPVARITHKHYTRPSRPWFNPTIYRVQTIEVSLLCMAFTDWLISCTFLMAQIDYHYGVPTRHAILDWILGCNRFPLSRTIVNPAVYEFFEQAAHALELEMPATLISDPNVTAAANWFELDQRGIKLPQRWIIARHYFSVSPWYCSPIIMVHNCFLQYGIDLLARFNPCQCEKRSIVKNGVLMRHCPTHYWVNRTSSKLVLELYRTNFPEFIAYDVEL